MTRPIDEKLVVMRMDNSDFKSKAKETTSLFDKLKQTFQNIKTGNLNNVTKDLSGISKAANSVDMTSLGRSVDQVAGRFSTLGVVATTTLATITNHAVNTGLQLSKSLGMDQVTSGFSEYETKINSIKTVLSNTEWAGTNLDDVKKGLQELNDYADQTIYNFAEMTRNVGRFTAAGSTLEDSVIAIQGMGNLAAASGATGEQLNRAMYQTSQALAGGYFQLMDWNSIEEASMGGKKTKDALMETAAEMGVAIDKSKTFRESLKDGWLTSEVFLATMKKFGEDQSMIEAATTVRTFTQLMDNLKETIGSGWATSWELIFGDYEEATWFWSYISDSIGVVFDKMTKARNANLSTIFGDGGTITILQTIVNILTPIRKVVGAIGEAWKETFPSDGGAGIRAFIDNFETLTSKLDLSEGSFNAIKTIFTALFQALKLGGNIVIGFAGALSNLFPAVGAIAGGILSLISYVFKIPATFGKAANSGDGLGTAFDFLGTILSKVSDIIVYLVGGLSNLGSVAASALGVLFSGNYANGPWSDDSKIVKWLTGIHDAFSSLFGFLSGFSFEAIGSGFVTFFDWLVSGAANIKQVLSNIGNWIAGLSDMFIENQGWILAGGGLAGLGAVLWKVWEVISAFSKPLAGFGEILENAGESLQAFTYAVHARSILVIAVAVGILAGAFMLMSNLNSTQITTGLYAIAGSLGAIVGSLILLSRYSKEMAIGSLQIVAISVAIIALSKAVADLGAMGIGDLTKGIVGMTAVLGALVGAVILITKYSKQMAVGSVQLIAIAGAVALIAFAMQGMSDMDPGGITKGLITIGALLTALALFAKVASSSSATLVTSAAGIVAISASIILMVQAIKMIDKIDQGALTKGLLNIAGMLAVIAGFAIAVSKTKIGTAAVSIGVMAAALTLLLIPISALGNMESEKIGKGLLAISVALAALAVTSHAMQSAIGGAVAMTIMAAALNLLIIPIAALGALPWQVLTAGIIALGAGLAVVAGVSLLLAPAAIPMLAFGVAIAAMGAGMSLFGKGLIVLTGLTVAAVTTFVAAVGALITGATALLPAFADLMQKVVNSILDTITEKGPAILDKIAEVIKMVLDKIVEHGPSVLEKVGDVLLLVLDFLISMLPKIVEVVVNMMLELIAVVGEKSSEFAQAATDLILNFLASMEENIPKVVDAGYEFMINLINALTETVSTKGPELIDAFLTLMGEVVKVMITAGLSAVDALFGWIPGVKEATTAIGQNAYNYIDENFRAKDLADQKGVEFSDGIYQASPLAEEAAKAMANAGVQGAESVDASPAGTSFGDGFAQGMQSNTVFGKIRTAATNLATAAYNKLKETLDINSPSKETEGLGKNTGEGFALGINAKTPDVRKAIEGYKKEVTTTGKTTAKESAKQGEAVGKSAGTGVAKGVKQSTPAAKKQAAKSAEDIAKEMKDKFKQEMDDAEYKFEMGELDYEGYIAELNRIKTAYSKYGGLVKEVNLEIKKAEEDAAKRRDELRKAEFQAFKDDISEKKYYNSLDLMDELRVWEIARKKYAEGTEERKEADREVYRLKNEINQKLLDLNEEYIGKINDLTQQEIDQIKEVEDAYSEAFDSRVNDLTNFVGLFDEVVKNEEITGGQLIANLKSQFTALEQWTKDIQSLAARGLDEALLGTLQEMGPGAASEISALNSLTDSQLAEYAEIWRKKNELARTQATAELATLRQETDLKITQIREDSAAQLDIYKKEWLRRITEIKEGTKDQFVSLHSDMNVIARNAMDGLAIGLESKRGEVMAVAQSIADAITETIKSAMEVASPSKVMKRIGGWVGEGLAIGMTDTIKSVARSAYGLADTVTSTLDNVLNDTIVPEIDTEIKVRAVVEYDNNPLDSINLVPNLDFANSALASTRIASGQNDNTLPTTQAASTQPNINIEQKLEFHTREMTPSEVARKNLQTSRQLVAQLTTR